VADASESVARQRGSAAAVASGVNPSRTRGSHWLAGIGLDHAWPLESLLLSGNVYAERFVGLYVPTDWTAEIGSRKQWTPRLVFDLGVVRHFSGVVRSTAATVGLTFTMSTRPVAGASSR
jgi:hypothetical protein